MFGNAVHLYAGNRNPGRVWQYGNSTTLAIGTRAACGNRKTRPRVATQHTYTLAIGTRAACGNRKTRPRVATQHTYTLAIGTRAACGNRKQGRVWQYTLGSPGPVLQRTRRGVRRNRVALTHANYGQRRVWQYTLAISAACGNTRWQSEKGGRVWQSTLANKKGAACGNHAATSAARGWPYARIRNHKVYPPSTLA